MTATAVPKRPSPKVLRRRSSGASLRHEAVKVNARQARRWMVALAAMVVVVLVTPAAFITAVDALEIGTTNFRLFHFRQLPNMKLKARRSSDSECVNYGVAKDPYFKHYGGVLCAASTWQAQDHAPSPMNFVQQIEVVTKTFNTDRDAHEYYVRFWGRHMYEPLPYMMWVDLTLNTLGVGEDHHAFVWDPHMMGMQVPAPQETAKSKHSVYLFRTGRTMVKLTASGFSQAHAPDLTPGFLADLAEVLHQNIQENDPSPTSLAVRRQARTMEATLSALKQSAHDVTTRCLVAVKSGLIRVWSSLWQGPTDTSTSSVPSSDDRGEDRLPSAAQPEPDVVAVHAGQSAMPLSQQTFNSGVGEPSGMFVEDTGDDLYGIFVEDLTDDEEDYMSPYHRSNWSMDQSSWKLFQDAQATKITSVVACLWNNLLSWSTMLGTWQEMTMHLVLACFVLVLFSGPIVLDHHSYNKDRRRSA